MKLCYVMKLFGSFLWHHVFSDFLELPGSWLPFEDPLFCRFYEAFLRIYKMLHLYLGPVLPWLFMRTRLRAKAGRLGSWGLCSADSAGQVQEVWGGILGDSDPHFICIRERTRGKKAGKKPSPCSRFFFFMFIFIGSMVNSYTILWNFIGLFLSQFITWH